MENWQYYGLFLDIDTKNMLMNVLTDNMDYNKVLGEADKIFIDHCTLLHKSQLHGNCDLYNYLSNNLGKNMSVKIVAVGISTKAMAFKLEPLEGICANDVPHITIATLNGGKPVDSNKIIKWNSIEPIIVNTTLRRI